MFNTPDELQMFLMAQTAMQRGRPSIRQYMMPQYQPPPPPSPMAVQMPSPYQMMPQQEVTASPINYQGANNALTQRVAPRPGGMNPMSMALLAAGMRTLQASGPSTQQRSLGQIIGTGGMEGLNTYAQQRHQQFQEGQMAENSDLRREQIESLRGMREAQAGELASKAEERARISGLMGRYQQAVASGDQSAAMQIAREMYPQEVLKDSLKDPTERNFQFQEEFTGRMIDGKPEVQKYVITGRNPDGTPKVVPWGKPAPKGAINEITVDARSFDKTEGAERAKAVQERQVAAMKTEDFAGTVQLLADVLEGYSGGPLTQFQAQIGRVFPESEYGKIASVDDLARGLIGKAAPMIRATGSGATSDFEFKQFMAALPSLAQTPDGRRMMAAVAQRMAQREVVASDIYGELAEKGPVKLAAWRAETRKRLGDLFSKEELKSIRGGGAKAPIAVNPQTGERREFRGGQWQKIP